MHTGKDHHVKIVNLKAAENAHATSTKNADYISKFGRAARELGELWTVDKANARDPPGGGMLSLGTWKGTIFDGGMHRETKQDEDIREKHCQLNKLARTIAEKFFPDAFKSITETMKFFKIENPDFLGGEAGLCNQMVQSGHGFYCEAHFDLDVSEYSISIWNSEDGTDPEGWYFVLPIVGGKYGGKGYKGVAIRLRDGVGIEWNGRSLRHCSTSPKKKNVFGTFFGIMRI